MNISLIIDLFIVQSQYFSIFIDRFVWNMRITVIESSLTGSDSCLDTANEVVVKQEDVPSPCDQGTSESGKSTPVETKHLIENHYSTRGIKVRYVSDPEDDDFDSNGNSKKKKKISVRASKKRPSLLVKKEARDNGGVYQPSKKKVYRKVDPNRCQDCRQRLDDPNLKVLYTNCSTFVSIVCL